MGTTLSWVSMLRQGTPMRTPPKTRLPKRHHAALHRLPDGCPVWCVRGCWRMRGAHRAKPGPRKGCFAPLAAPLRGAEAGGTALTSLRGPEPLGTAQSR